MGNAIFVQRRLPNRVTRLVATFAGLLGLAGCQTTAPDLNRGIASGAGLSEKAERILRNDTFEAFGLAARGVLYEKRLARAQVLAGLVPANQAPSHWDAVALESAAAIGIAAVAASCILASANGGASSGAGYEALFGRLATRFFKGDESMAALGVGSVAGPILASSAGIFLTAYVSPDKTRGEGEALGALHFIFRRSAYLESAQRAADAQNAKAQADFVAALKASATELARRWATLLRLQPSETTSLEIKFETRMLDEFKSEKVWRAGDEMKVDVRKILRFVVADADARYKALEVVVQSVAGGPAKAITDVAGALAYYDDEIKQLQALDAAVLAKYKELFGSKVAAVKNLAIDYYAFSTEIEKYQRSLELHRKMLAGAGI